MVLRRITGQQRINDWVLAKEVVVGTLNTLYAEEAFRQSSERGDGGGAVGAMVNRFGSLLQLFLSLLVLLYFPCVSVVATHGES